MAGHSKWANIKRRKAAVDAKRGRIFSKLGREIIMAARQGGPNPDANPRLRAVIDKARSVNMPLDSIQRAIHKAVGGVEGADYEELTYEGYGPGGVALLLEILTDNRNRTAQEIRHLFTKHGGNLGEAGCVAWLFEPKGLLIIDRTETPVDEDAVLLPAADAGAEDVTVEEGALTIVTRLEDLDRVRRALEEQGFRLAHAGPARVPQTTVRPSAEDAQRVERLIEALEDHDDVREVYSNLA